jgi:cytochrome c5
MVVVVMEKPDKAQIDRAWESVQAAVRKFNAGKPQDEECVFCHATIVVDGFPTDGPCSSWDVHCPCGKSNTTLKGL